MHAARRPDAPLVHEHWGDNVFLESFVDRGIGAALDAPIQVTREISTARQCMAPMEGRGVVAIGPPARPAQLYTANQMPHIVRTGLAECLGLTRSQVRVVSPDVGGGFGYKGILLPEEVCLGLAGDALRPSGALDRGPARASDRRRQLPRASLPHHRLCGPRRTLRGVDCEATVDSGAYSSYPFSACLEAAQVASILPGPYDFPPIAAAPGRSPPTNARSCPIAASRARAFASRWSSCSMRSRARPGIEPCAMRLKNLVRPEQMPFDNITNKHFDSGDYPAGPASRPRRDRHRRASAGASGAASRTGA